MVVNDPKLQAWLDDWNKHYGNESQFKATYKPGERNKMFSFVEGMVEMAKHISTSSSRANVTLQTNDLGVTRLTIDVTPNEAPTPPTAT